VNKQKYLAKQRQRRRRHVRRRVRGTSDRPRLSVFRSHTHIAAQIIDDSRGATLVAASTYEKEVRQKTPYGGNCAAARIVGQLIAERALAAGIRHVRFDRGHYRYHGRVASLAEGAREAGLGI